MSTVAEIEAALKRLPVEKAQNIGQVRIQETTNMATTTYGNGNN